MAFWSDPATVYGIDKQNKLMLPLVHDKIVKTVMVSYFDTLPLSPAPTPRRISQVRKWVLTPNVPAPPPKPFFTHTARTWVMLNWRPAAGSNEKVTAYVVSWRMGRKGHFDDELTVRAAQLL